MNFWKRLRSAYNRYGFTGTMVVAYSKMRKYVEALRKYKEIEERQSFGVLNENNIFYVIRMSKVYSSLGPVLIHVLLNLKECDMNNYTPVIDFRCFPNLFQEVGEEYHVNTWLYFFDQPTFWGTDAVYHSKNVILGDPLWRMSGGPKVIYPHFIENLSEYCYLFKKYIHINGRLLKKFSYIDEMIKNNGMVLGVAFRGTDYNNKRHVGENRQPLLDTEIRDAVELKSKWGCQKVYLMTEDMGALDVFKKAFGDDLLYLERQQRFSSDVDDTFAYKRDMEHAIYFRAEEYLAEMYALSRCHCLLSPRAGHLIPVLCMNNMEYLHTYIYDLGYYTESD